jgi:hypothetical protein
MALAAPRVGGPPIDLRAEYDGGAVPPMLGLAVRAGFGVGPPVLAALVVLLEKTLDLRGLLVTTELVLGPACAFRSCSCLAVRLR